MKKLILIAGLILISHLSFPQIKSINYKSPSSSFWSIGFSGGVPLKLSDKVDSRYESHSGYIWGVNLFINIDKNTAIGAEFNFGRFFSGNINSYPNGNEYNSFSEITFGPKFHIGNNFYALIQLGNYFNVYKHKYEYRYLYSYNQSESYPGFGISLGLEKNIKLNENVNLNLNEKLSLGLPGMEPIFYGMLRAGITFNEVIHPVETDKRQSDKTHSISLSGGFTSSLDPANNWEYNFTPNISIEGTVKTSPNIEMFGNITYNKFSSDYGYSWIAYASMTETTVGSRFFIGSQNYSGFLQIGGGLYYPYFRPHGYSGGGEMYWGLNAGTGAKIKVYKNFSAVVLGRMHIIINEYSGPGGYFNTSCGIRYEI